MTKIKLCGLSRLEDIEVANELLPEYIGFVFAPESKRYVTPAQAKELRGALSKEILAVGVFVNEDYKAVAELLNAGIIDVAQLHGGETDAYIQILRAKTNKPIIKTFKHQHIALANDSLGDYVMIDSGKGSGRAFNWNLLKDFKRPYFLAGGLTPKNVGYAIERLHPFAVDVSSGIETDGLKDADKMREFVRAVRGDVK
ncbi:MAG: phosphoribosylanthranilate isomerase [Selenomonadaceae bacterium]|nr:phosphoribosylanthranilate isomerase [Selenomonadaceae bacterium]